VRIKSLLVILGCLVSSISLSHAPATLNPAPELPTLDEVRRIAEERRPHTDSCRFELSSEVTTVKGAYNLERRASHLNPDPAVDIPGSEIPLPCSMKIIFHGGAIRKETLQTIWNISTNSPDEYHEITTFKDGLCRRLYISGKSARLTTRNDAVGLSLKTFWDGLTLDYLSTPNLAVLREMDWEGKSVLIVGNTDYNDMLIDGRPVLGATRMEFYLDPSRGYLPVRYLHMLPSGIVVNDIQIKYADQSGVGFFPSLVSWQSNVPVSGELMNYATVQLSSLTLNEPIDPSVFDLEFPPGYTLVDEIREEEDIIGEPGSPDTFIAYTGSRASDPYAPLAPGAVRAD